MNFFTKWWNNNSPQNIRDIVEGINNKVSDLHEWESESKLELERELELIKTKFEKQKNLTISVIDHLDDMMWCKDLAGKYILANKSFRENFCYGVGWDEIEGKTDIELSKKFKKAYGELNHTYGDICDSSDRLVIESEKPMKFLESGKIGGKEIKLVVNKSPIYNFRGILFGTCGTGRDVTQWFEDLVTAIEDCNLCNNKEGKELLLKELNKFTYLGEGNVKQ